MKLHLLLAGLVVAAVLVASSAFAGVVMVYEQQPGAGTAKKKTTTLYVSSDRMRMEDEKGDVNIFRGDKKLFWMIDRAKGTYTEITQDDLTKMRARVDEAMKRLQAQLQNVPPEQRKMVESMMKGRMPQEAPRMEYRKGASGVRVNRWVCDRYDGYLGREKTQEIYTADPGQFHMRRDDFRVFDQVREFSEAFSKGSKDALPLFGSGNDEGTKGSQVSGVPVRVVQFSEGAQRERSDLTDLRHQDIAPSLFELPAGLKKREMRF